MMIQKLEEISVANSSNYPNHETRIAWLEKSHEQIVSLLVDLKQDFKDLRTDIKTEINTLKSEMKNDFRHYHGVIWTLSIATWTLIVGSATVLMHYHVVVTS